ncbi:MAG: ATP-grasp domain-containing protein [Fimbriimonadales bacterium]|nr:ATP-grasp domain-containing protein [Fimbriimonadales bacterium]
MSLADLGILGEGPMARYVALAAEELGATVRQAPARGLADAVDLLGSCGRVVLTGKLPASTLRQACEALDLPPSRVLPHPESLETIEDKLLQKSVLLREGVATVRAVPLEKDGQRAVEEIGFPMTVKARMGSMGGVKSVRFARNPSELQALRPLWQGGGWLAEPFVPYMRELAVVVYVSPHGVGCFPTMETFQTQHVCDLVFPGRANAAHVALQAVRSMASEGVFAVTLFEMDGGELLVDKIVPRPHGSGLHTLDWGGVSQFEQIVRVALGLTPALPEGAPVCTASLYRREEPGDLRRALRAAMQDPTVRVHWYGNDAPGGRVGHIGTAGGPDLIERAVSARERFNLAWSTG